MIQANELRIGNYYQAFDSIHKVKELTYDANVDVYFDCGISTNGMNPIMLTEDILLKCGFERSRDDNSWYHENLYAVIAQNTGVGYWRIDPETKYAWDKKEYDNKLYLTSEREYTISEKPIETLHQLQNLYFALTGKELEVKL